MDHGPPDVFEDDITSALAETLSTRPGAFIGGVVAGHVNGKRAEGMIVDFRNGMLLSG